MMLARVLIAGLALGEATLNLRTGPFLATEKRWSFGKYLLSGISTSFSVSAALSSMHSMESSTVRLVVFAMGQTPSRSRTS